MTHEAWHVTPDGDRMRRLGDGPGRERDDAGRWRPIDRANPGPSPKGLLHREWAWLRSADTDRRELYESHSAVGDPPSLRPLGDLHADLRAGRPLKGRDAERVVLDSVQGRQFYGVQVPRRSSLLGLYDDAISAGADEAEAQHRAAAEEAQRRWRVDHDDAPPGADDTNKNNSGSGRRRFKGGATDRMLAMDWTLVLEASREAVEQAVRRRNVKPPPGRIIGLWQADTDGIWQLIADYRADAAPEVEQPQGPARGPAARRNRAERATSADAPGRV